MAETAAAVRAGGALRRRLRRRTYPLADLVDANATVGTMNVLLGAYPFLANPAATQPHWIPALNLAFGALLLIRCYWLVVRRKGRGTGRSADAAGVPRARREGGSLSTRGE